MRRLESDYYEYMGFDPENHRQVLSFYLPKLAGHAPVLELGPGPGVFLEMLAEAGVEARGVDVDEGMVKRAQERGLDVVAGDALEYLHGTAAPGTYQGVFCSHFLEHLTPEQVIRLLEGVRRVLAPGGRFLASTPNAACYAVLTHDFWRDPTHVRFYDLKLLTFLCEAAGLRVEEAGTNPANHPGPPPHLRFSAGEVTAYPPLADLIQQAAAKASAALEHGGDGQPVRQLRPHDSAGVQELAHLLGVVEERVRCAEDQLRKLATAYENLIRTLYESNEIYVMARAA